MGEPMPRSIPRYDVVRNGSALPVRINRIAFKALFSRLDRKRRAMQCGVPLRARTGERWVGSAHRLPQTSAGKFVRNTQKVSALPAPLLIHDFLCVADSKVAPLRGRREHLGKCVDPQKG